MRSFKANQGLLALGVGLALAAAGPVIRILRLQPMRLLREE